MPVYQYWLDILQSFYPQLSVKPSLFFLLISFNSILRNILDLFLLLTYLIFKNSHKLAKDSFYNIHKTHSNNPYPISLSLQKNILMTGSKLEVQTKISLKIIFISEASQI